MAKIRSKKAAIFKFWLLFLNDKNEHMSEGNKTQFG